MAKGKLKLPSPPQEWFEKVVEHHGLAVLPLELSVCIAAAQLPPIHADPCDRFIILNGAVEPQRTQRTQRVTAVGQTDALTQRVRTILFPGAFPCVLCALCGWSTALSRIIATAKLHDLTVVTTAEQFEKYGVTVIC